MNGVEENNGVRVDAAVKYDRQLRLWGDQGQKQLEKAHVCLVNANPAGLETLKNLVLPGIGAFTIVDSGRVVTNRDLGNNFFVHPDDLGKQLGDVTCRYLLDLNPDVRGSFVEDKLEDILEKDGDSFFKKFTLVVGCLPIDEGSLMKLDEVLYESNIPFVLPRAYGLWATLRTVVKEHYVIEAHPESSIPDLRLDRLDHIPGLIEFSHSQNLDQMTREKHMHTPYLILLIKFLEKWRELPDSGGKPPKSYKEKKQFKELLREGMKHKENSQNDDEENFEEAIKAVNTAFIATSVPSNVQTLFGNPQCQNLTLESTNFWILAKALHQFVQNEGQNCLPVRGKIPDMTSDSDRYIKLQTLYQDAAKSGVSAVMKYTQEILRSLGKPVDSIPFDEVKRFCQNSSTIQVVSTISLRKEYSNADENSKLNSLLDTSREDDPSYLMPIYVLLRAADEFYHNYKRFPGEIDGDFQSDLSTFKTCVASVLTKISPGGNASGGCGHGPASPAGCIPSPILNEALRFAGGELHVMASFIGGIAAHECIKLITNQYEPMRDIFIFNSINSLSETIFIS